MGGFTLIGPHYVFQNLPNIVRCRCLGYTGTIDLDTENLLLNDPAKKLNLENLPDELLLLMEGYHLGDEMRYTVKKRIPEKGDRYAKTQGSHRSQTNHNPFGGTELEFHSDVLTSSNTDPITSENSPMMTAKTLKKHIMPWFRK